MTEPTIYSPPRPILANGAVLYASITTPNGDRYVMAYFKGPQPWVTWVLNPETRSTVEGHYFSTSSAAHKDLLTRASR